MAQSMYAFLIFDTTKGLQLTVDGTTEPCYPVNKMLFCLNNRTSRVSGTNSTTAAIVAMPVKTEDRKLWDQAQNLVGKVRRGLSSEGVSTDKQYVYYCATKTKVVIVNNDGIVDKAIAPEWYDDSAPQALYRGNQVINFGAL